MRRTGRQTALWVVCAAHDVKSIAMHGKFRHWTHDARRRRCRRNADIRGVWDGDLGREVQDNIYISKWNPEKEKVETIFTASGCTSVNGTKANPSLTADLFGDWREEVMYPL